MYCSTCGVGVTAGLIYCKNCGSKLGGGISDGDTSAEPRPELLVSAMVGLFVLGLVAIAVLAGVLRQAVGFDLLIVLTIIAFSCGLLLTVEGILIWMLLRNKKGKRAAANALSEQHAQYLQEGYPGGLHEPMPSVVTDHTTRSLEPVLSEPRSR